MKGNVKVWLLCGLSAATLVGDELEDSLDVGVGEWSARVGYGYKENVLFSEIAPIDSPFGFVSIEGMASREFVNTASVWTTMGFLDNRNYVEGGDLPEETFGVLVTEYGRFLTIDGRLAAGLQYVYFNQAFDATFDVRDLQQIVLEAHEPRAYLEWEAIIGPFGYKANAGASRTYFADPTNDYETADWEIELDYLTGEASRWILAANGFARDYTDRSPRALDGSRVDSLILGSDQIGVEAAFERSLGILGLAGEIEASVDFEARRDRHFGYYDRDSLKYGLEWSGGNEGWQFRVDLGIADREYRLQRVEDGGLRRSEEWVWGVEIERALNESWRLFLNVNHEGSESNETFFSYEANSVLLGLRFR